MKTHLIKTLIGFISFIMSNDLYCKDLYWIGGTTTVTGYGDASNVANWEDENADPITSSDFTTAGNIVYTSGQYLDFGGLTLGAVTIKSVKNPCYLKIGSGETLTMSGRLGANFEITDGSGVKVIYLEFGNSGRVLYNYNSTTDGQILSNIPIYYDVEFSNSYKFSNYFTVVNKIKENGGYLVTVSGGLALESTATIDFVSGSKLKITSIWDGTYGWIKDLRTTNQTFPGTWELGDSITTSISNKKITTGSFNNLKINTSASLNGDVSIESDLSFNNSGIILRILGNTLTIKGSITNGSNGKLRGSTTSNLVCSTTNNTIYIDQATLAHSTLNNLTISNGATITLGSNLIINSTLTLGSNTLNIGSNTLTFSGTSAQPISRSSGLINTTNSTVKYAQTASGNYTLTTAAYTSNSTYKIYNLTLDFTNASGGTLTIDGDLNIGNNLTMSTANNYLNIDGKTLTINGTVSMNSGAGKFIGGSTSSVSCGATGTVYFSQSGTDNYIKNFTVNNSKTITLGNTLNIVGGTSYGSLTVEASSTLVTNNFLRLKSDANGTARIANSPGTISGNYYAEQYFPANREYRFICAPVVGATALQWRNNGSTTSHTGLGISITGANPSSNSFDASTANKPSAFWYDETIAGSVTNVNSTGTDDPGWTSISNGNTYGLTNGKGFRVLVRGDRDISLTTSSPSPSTTTITSYGSYPRTSGSYVELNVSNTNRTSETNNGLNLVGNPFPSAIDWNSIALSNVDNGYATYDPVGHKYVAWNGSLGDATRYISSGQAFFVMCTSSGTGTLTVEEADKYDGKGGNFFLEKLSNHMRINLMYDSTYNSDAFIHFRDDASDVKDVYDIQQFYVNGTNIASLDKNGKPYKINSLKTLDSLTVVPLSIAGTPEASLKLSFYDIPSFYGYKLELVDTYLKKTVEITEGMIYNLDITSDSFTVKDGRFYINIAKIPGLKNRSFESNKIANIYPNPIQDKMAIRLDKKITQANYEIFNSIGQMITKGTIESPESTINTSSYSNGTYYLIVKTNNSSQTIQFVK